MVRNSLVQDRILFLVDRELRSGADASKVDMVCVPGFSKNRGKGDSLWSRETATFGICLNMIQRDV